MGSVLGHLCNLHSIDYCKLQQRAASSDWTVPTPRRAAVASARDRPRVLQNFGVKLFAPEPKLAPSEPRRLTKKSYCSPGPLGITRRLPAVNEPTLTTHAVSIC